MPATSNIILTTINTILVPMVHEGHPRPPLHAPQLGLAHPNLSPTPSTI